MPWKTLSAFFLSIAALPAAANIEPYPSSFSVQEIRANGTTLHVRVGGTGPAVVLLHGFGDTGDMWAPLAASLASDHTVIVPDLRGMGLSAVAEHGFEKMNQAKDIAEAQGLSDMTLAIWSLLHLLSGIRSAPQSL
jgi:pimeloyl-ACP methyl ester carboxylesterase